LIDEYDNLMYSCDECNLRKGDRSPPAGARADGHRFFRPDRDVHEEHFEGSEYRLDPKSNVGAFSIEMLDLNRLGLRRLREIRERLTQHHNLVVQGVLGLRKFPIDRLPLRVRGAAFRSIQQASRAEVELADSIDSLLREYARSPLIDPDP